ncbi:MAG: thiamine pyrophosphate-dependent enzyme, partial [bacterium]
GVPASEAMEQCDLLLIVGADCPYTSFYPKKARIVQIEPVPARMGRRAAIAAPLRGHAKPTLEALLETVDRKVASGFYQRILRIKGKWRQEQTKAEQSGSKPIKPQRLIADIAATAPDDAIFLCDTGTTTAWTARHLPIGERQRYTLSSSLASMAFGMPGAIGAQLLYPERRVIAITGDGGFTMLMGDFVTAAHHKLPIVCVVLNNAKLGFIALEQEAKGLPEHSIDLLNPDFAAFAEACGGFGRRVEEPDEIVPALEEALASRKPAILDVKTNPNELIMPPRITLEQAANFGLAKWKEFWM